MKRFIIIASMVLSGASAFISPAICRADETVIGSNQQTGGEGAGDRQTMEDIRARTAALRNQQQH